VVISATVGNMPLFMVQEPTAITLERSTSRMTMERSVSVNRITTAGTPCDITPSAMASAILSVEPHMVS